MLNQIHNWRRFIDLAGALISRIVQNDIAKSDDVSRESYNLPQKEGNEDSGQSFKGY